MPEQRSVAVANYVINLARESGHPITPLALQKLLYYVHGHSFARLGHGAVNAAFEAWKYGPVIPSLYRHLRKYGSQPITSEIEDHAHENLGVIDPDLARVSRSVWKAYGYLDGGQLVDMTHKIGTPWYQTYNKSPYANEVIPNDLIRDYFVARDAV
jgi:uncharacterized phage-associated protein